MTQELSAHELKLLAVAVPYAQDFKEKEGRMPSRDELRDKLSTGVHNAQRVLNYMVAEDVLKVAARLEKLPVTAEAKAHTQYAIGDTSGSLVSHVLRENARLTRRLAKKKHEQDSTLGVLNQEVREEIEALKVLAKQELSKIRKPSKAERAVVATGNMLEINIADAHIGKLSWDRETGHESYDTKIADAMYRRAQNALFDRAKGVKIEKVLLVIGNDLLNSDNAEGTTTKGTQVSTDGRYHKTFYRARTLLIDSVEQARKVAPVHVIVMPGNHDRLACFHVGDSLECYFHGQPDVTIDNEPVSRKYVQFGNVMLMFCHGDRGKRADFPLVMASEKPEMWGSTKFRECHTGHLHTTRTEEMMGVRVRILPSLSPPDAWHADNAFVGNLRSAEGYIWNREEGLIGQVFYNDDAQAPITTKREIVK